MILKQIGLNLLRLLKSKAAFRKSRAKTVERLKPLSNEAGIRKIRTQNYVKHIFG